MKSNVQIILHSTFLPKIHNFTSVLFNPDLGQNKFVSQGYYSVYNVLLDRLLKHCIWNTNEYF